MASAPTPGAADRAAAVRASLTVTVRGETRVLYPNNMTMELRVAIRKQTGLPFQTWMDQMDLDSLCVIWWLAGVQSGSEARSYSFPQAVAQWPDDLTPDAGLT